MAGEIKLEVIKKTQNSLGKYVTKPPLTEKLLRKPPFRFLHDVISADRHKEHDPYIMETRVQEAERLWGEIRKYGHEIVHKITFSKIATSVAAIVQSPSEVNAWFFGDVVKEATLPNLNTIVFCNMQQ